MTATTNISRLGILVIWPLGLLLCVAVRLIHYNQSLWCDEMGVLLDYAHQPWRVVLAAGPGEYVPSNHFLHTILTKIILGVADGNGSLPMGALHTARLIRLPALIAGSLVPVALAWPFLRRSPLVAMLLILFAAINPYLVEYSDEARGYTLMTLLGLIATHLLPNGSRRWPIGYALATASMIYTVPVGAMLVIAHGIALFSLRRTAITDWLRGIGITGAIVLLLYLPMARGILYYTRHPQSTPDSFVDFINQLPRMVVAGEHLPEQFTGFAGEAICWIAPVLILAVGSFFAWRQSWLQMPILVMSCATGLFVIVTFFLPSAGQVRFVPWCALWMVIAIAAIAQQLFIWRGTPAMLLLVFIFAGWFIYRDIALLPAQPIRDAIAQADATAPPGEDIFIGFLAADDCLKIYGNLAEHHRLIATPGPRAFLQMEQRTKAETGHLPWLVVSFEPMVQKTIPQFWEYIQSDYVLNQQLAGRISAVAIYQPRLR